jgi:CheY-like chemotaxis protein
MGILSAAIALFTNGGVGQQGGLRERPSDDKAVQNCTILVMDDDPAALLTVKTLLVKRGFNVLSSSSAPKGLDLLHYAARDIRIVVLDCNMPKLDGGETLKFIKQLSPSVKVIGLTAVQFDSLPRGYIDSIDKLLSKPVVATTLMDAVYNVLGVEQTASARTES